jgi:ABC-2 type transport system permease protein
MIGDVLRGAALVAGQEFRIRLRTGRWRSLLGAWVLVLGLFTIFVYAALGTTSQTKARGVPLFGFLMLFVLGLVLVISPALTAQSVNGDRERGTLATLQITRLSPAQIALGKLAAGWAVGLVALALTVPFVGFAMLAGGPTFARAAGVLAVAALLMGVVCAVSQALSALLARSITSALLSYVVVFALTVGTLIAFAIASPLVADQRTGPDGYVQSESRPDRIWWLIAPNPFVILADSAPRLPPRVIERGGGRSIVVPNDALSSLSEGVRSTRRSPYRSGVGYGADDQAVWPFGLGFDLLLAAGAVWVTTRRLRAPSRRLARGVRVG